MNYELRKAHSYIKLNKFERALEIYESFLKNNELPDGEKEYYALCLVYGKILNDNSIVDINYEELKKIKKTSQNGCFDTGEFCSSSSDMLELMSLEFKNKKYDEVINFGIHINKDFLNDEHKNNNSYSEREYWYALMIKSFYKLEKYEVVSILYSLAERDCYHFERIKNRYFPKGLRELVDVSVDDSKHKTEFTEIYNDFSSHGDIYDGDGRSISYNDLFRHE